MIMRTLCDLPDELLLQIISHLTSGTSTHGRRANLQSVILTSKRLLQIGQDFLYCAIAPSAHQNQKSSHGKASTIALLVRTLIERPYLANLVHELDITVIKRRVIHASCRTKWSFAQRRRVFECKCGVADAIRLATKFLKNKPYKNEPWKKDISQGKEPAFYGLLVALASNLEHIAVRLIYRDVERRLVRTTGPMRSRAYDIYEERHFSGRVLFGRNISNLNLRDIPGLANVKSFACPNLLPPPIFSLPQMRHVEFGIENWELSGGFRGMPTCFSLCPNPPSLSNITALTIHIAAFVLEGGFHVWEIGHYPGSCYSYLLKLANRMENLRYLGWSVVRSSFHDSDTAQFPFGYSNLFHLITNPKVETIVIVSKVALCAIRFTHSFSR